MLLGKIIPKYGQFVDKKLDYFANFFKLSLKYLDNNKK